MMDKKIEYIKPTIEKLGSFREITRAGTELGFGDTSGGIWRFLITAPGTS